MVSTVLNKSLSISKVEMQRFCALLNRCMGLHLPKEIQNGDLQIKLSRIVDALGFAEVGLCLDFLEKNPLAKRQIEFFARELTVGETYFFRHEQMYQILEKFVLPEIIHQKKLEPTRQLRIWSCACCSGEEPYSVAILLKQLIFDLKKWNIFLLGSDINPDFLEKARVGSYTEWSFRETPPEKKKLYFEQTENQRYLLQNDIKDMVQLRELNLMNENYPSALTHTDKMDLILCNNILIYFSKSHIERVVNRLVKSLVEGGWLVVSSVEVPCISHPNLVPETIEGMTFFRKQTAPKQKKDVKQGKSKSTEVETIEKVVPEETVKNKDTGFEVIQKIRKSANKGNLLEARHICEKAIALNKVEPVLYHLYAVILLELDDFDEAVRALKKALFLDSNLVIAQFTLGNAMLLSKNYKEAKRCLRNTLELLRTCDAEKVLPGTEDITAERLKFMVRSLELQM